MSEAEKERHKKYEIKTRRIRIWETKRKTGAQSKREIERHTKYKNETGKTPQK